MTGRQLARQLLHLAGQEVKPAELPAALQAAFTALKQAAGSMAVADRASLTYADMPAEFRAKVTEQQFIRTAEKSDTGRAVARG